MFLLLAFINNADELSAIDTNMFRFILAVILYGAVAAYFWDWRGKTPLPSILQISSFLCWLWWIVKVEALEASAFFFAVLATLLAVSITAATRSNDKRALIIGVQMSFLMGVSSIKMLSSYLWLTTWEFQPLPKFGLIASSAVLLAIGFYGRRKYEAKMEVLK